MKTYFRNLTILSVICIIFAFLYYVTPHVLYPMVISIVLYVSYMVIGFFTLKAQERKEEQSRRESIEKESEQW